MSLGNAWFRIEPDPARRLVRIVRTPEVLPQSAGEVRRVFAELTEPLRQFAAWKALLDLRHGPLGRNDDAFEDAAREAQRSLARGFTRVAVLVRSAVGKLQVRRLSGGKRDVFQDEAEALRFLESD